MQGEVVDVETTVFGEAVRVTRLDVSELAVDGLGGWVWVFALPLEVGHQGWRRLTVFEAREAGLL